MVLVKARSSTPLALLALAATATLLLAACSNPQDPDQGSTETSATRTDAEPTDVAPSSPETSAAFDYELDDRATFLAQGPDCEQLQEWFAEYPRDDDPATTARHVEQCGQATAALLNHSLYPGDDPALMSALLANGADDQTRAVAHWALAMDTCEAFEAGARSHWNLASTIEDFGGTSADYQPTIAAATQECPGQEAELTLFETDDVLGAASNFAQALASSGDVAASASDNEAAALAAVTCASLRDGEDLASASMLLSFDEGSAAELGGTAVALFCPSRI
ncbi:hypothetical protein RDV89_00805 [Nocardioides zeae]|uniref:DUF732 domain-containing protein n=1 Tax=Nocardioides imazamoxiresistens TaxID=3231893 RepID=A0ABU3PS24_9ACTN|nr:hypothetical protein [Nocardioides zeae]MDT9591585.1 hypothetical protein [Nocardioides zeae]